MASLSNLPSLFSPTSVSNCALWLDAADSSTVVRSGSNVSAWNDKSGKTTTTVVSGPTVSGKYINGYQTLRFNSNRITAPLASAVGTGDYALFSVWLTITGGTEVVLSVGSNGTNGALGYNGTYYNLFEWGQSESDFTAAKNQYVVQSGTRISSVKSCFVNGSNAPTASGALNLTDSNLYIGGSGFAINGEICEILVYSNTISVAQRQQVEGYLAWKWGLQKSLPTSHPYYNNPLIPNLVPNPTAVIPYPNTMNYTFLPTQISNCALWFDAADRTSMTFSNNTTQVTQWNDKSGNGCNATAIVYSSTGPANYVQNVLNNRSVLRFSSSGYNVNYARQSSNYSIFSIHYLSNVNAYGRVINADPSAGPTGYGQFFMGVGSEGSNVATFAGNNGFNDTTTNSPIVNNYRTWLLVEMVVSNTTTLTPYVFGSNQTTKVGTTGPFSYLQIGVDAFNSNAQYWPGDIAEIIFYSTALNTQQRQQVEGYLAWKWGLQASLPTTHPYYANKFIQNLPIPQLPLISISSNYFFNPNSISGLALWIDAADYTTVTKTSSNTITAVKDKSPQNVTLSNATGYTYATNIYKGSYPSFYNGNGGYAAHNTATLGVNSAFAVSIPFTFLFVAQQTAALTDYGTFIDSTSGSGRPYILQTTLQSPIGTGSSNLSNNPFIACAQFYTSGAMYVNGSSYYTGTLTTLTTGGITIGNRYSLSEAWPGHICEILIYSNSITTKQRQQLEGYLGWKWGLAKSLPTNHPYYLFPPT